MAVKVVDNLWISVLKHLIYRGEIVFS